MSTMSSVNYEIFKAEYYKPEWVKNERYEYCDGFYESLNKKGDGNWFKRFASVLHSFLL